MSTPRRSALLTESQVRAKRAPGTKLSEGAGRGNGRLVVRWGAGDTRWWYYRYSGPDGERSAIPLPASSLTQARALVAEHVQRAREARAGGHDLRAVLDAERHAQHEARAAAERVQRAAERGTLRVLLDAYVAHLERAKKQAAGDARRMFARHVHGARPDLSTRPAASLTPAEVTALVRRCVDAGHGRTAAKLRSYLRAAYALAQRAATDAAAPAALVELGVEHNPAAATAALSQFNAARARVLTEGELGAYLAALEDAPPSPARDALRLALWLGGQRPTQLLRVAPGDVDLQARVVVLRDPKGRRATPRLHLVPLAGDKALAIARARVRACAKNAPHLFSGAGKVATRIETCEELATPILAALQGDEHLLNAREVGVGQAQLRDVRRTAETMLAKLGVSRDVRAQLQSHGLGGVQGRHYDRHDYHEEKRNALRLWEEHLEGLLTRRRKQVEAPIAPASGNVVELRRAPRARGSSRR